MGRLCLQARILSCGGESRLAPVQPGLGEYLNCSRQYAVAFNAGAAMEGQESRAAVWGDGICAMTRSLATRLKNIFDVRNSLVGSENLEDVIRLALETSREKTRTQTASVFLFSKIGLLERADIVGVDKEGQPISNDWFPEERHGAGASFTGKAVPTTDDSRFGDPHWSNELENEDLDPVSRDKYLETLGTLRCAIAVPLNGQNRTYGVLEVVNKVGEDGKADPSCVFTQDDLRWLASIGSSLATAVSNLRRRSELKVLAEISQMLIESFGDPGAVLHIYQEIANRMVGPDLSYRACLIRLASDGNAISTVARAGDGITWDAYHDGPVPPMHGLAGRVWISGVKEIYDKIDERIEEFRNIEWIVANNLKSYAILPLEVGDRIFGTVSLFTGYRHWFSDGDIYLLESLAFLIASIAETGRLMGELRDIREELRTERDRILGAARVVGYNLSAQSLLHDYKHQLQRLQANLKAALNTSPSHRLRIVEKQIGALRKKEQQIKEEMEHTSTDRLRIPVDIDDVIQSVVRLFELELKGTGEQIDIVPVLSDRVPLFLAHEAEIRELVFNLVSNAIKAIRRAERKQGEVRISTGIVRREIPYIQIAVEDNGDGIGREVSERIFERGYTTDPGGTGLGLFVSRIIVQNVYGGKLEFESTVGKGTTFKALLPQRRLRA